MKNKIIIAGSDVGLMKLLQERLSFLELEVINDTLLLYDKIKTEKPKILILESILPQWDWDGYMMAKLVKFNSKLKEIKIILIVDRREKDALLLAQESRVDFVFTKGNPLEELIEEVKRYAGQNFN